MEAHAMSDLVPLPKDIESDMMELGIDEDLSTEIALAVASIVAESKLYKDGSANLQYNANVGHSILPGGPGQKPKAVPTARPIKIKSKSKTKIVKNVSTRASITSKAKKKKVKAKKSSSKDVTGGMAVIEASADNELDLDVGDGGYEESPISGDSRSPGGDDSVPPPISLDKFFSFDFKKLDKYDTTNKPSYDDDDDDKPQEKRYPIPVFQMTGSSDMIPYLHKVQSYIDHLGYHRVGEPAIRVNTKLSIKHLMNTARNLTKAGESIKCLHALILAIHFTNPCTTVDRFPIHFKSDVRGKEFKHVVLGIYVHGKFGAMGISRDPGLQDKTPTFQRLPQLINEFYRSYAESGHDLVEVKIGSIITHDPHSLESMSFKLGAVNFLTSPYNACEIELEKIAKKLRSQMGLACLKCINPTHGSFPSEAQSRNTKLVKKASLQSNRARSLAAKPSVGNTRIKAVASTVKAKTKR